MKYWLRKSYKAITAALGFFINTIGLVLSIIGAFQVGFESKDEVYILFLLIIAECFLIFAVIYTVISVIRNYHNQISAISKEEELIKCRESNKIIFENYKRIITYYKDFKDKLDVLANKHEKTIRGVKNAVNQLEEDGDEAVGQFLKTLEEDQFVDFRKVLMQEYNRFMVNVVDCLKSSVEEYLSTKGCNRSVSIAIKQLETPQNYQDIKKSTAKVYTAFRDSRTYNSKRRNETWEKTFSISKNSDFVFSIEKDYYIFNCIDKSFIDNGLYLNENVNFYENYNSGVTCTIYSCVKEERHLYGFLACDSFFDDKIQEKCGKNIYDYNVANMLMATAHIIALFLEKFLSVWDEFCVSKGNRDNDNLCNTMAQSVEQTRYKS